MEITGRIVDSASNEGVGRNTVNLFWDRGGICFLCSRKAEWKTKSDRHGKFSITVSADRNKFSDESLVVQVPMPSGYIGYTPREEDVEIWIGQYQPLIDLKFTVYRATTLRINMRRQMSDNFQYMNVSYRYSETGLGIINMGRPTKDTVLNVTTAAGLFTKISWNKVYGPGQVTEFQDSLLCGPGVNEYTLNF